MLIKKIKYLFFGLVLLLLFHFETLNIGSVKISHLWKGTLLLFLIFFFLRVEGKAFFIYKPLIWLSILQLINLEFFTNPLNAFLLFGTKLILPLVAIILLKYPFNSLKNGLIFFASFFTLSLVPYALGYLESLGELYELSAYDNEQEGIVGPFQGAHAASTALAGSFLVILYFWFTKAFNRIYLSALLILCFYFLIFTYVRTGMLMVVIGVLPMLIFFAKEKVSTRIRLFIVGGLLAVLISGWVLSNKTVMDRIVGERKWSSETESFETLGSGRGLLYLYAVEIFFEANTIEKIIGMGQTEQKNRMESKLGLALVPHNGFLLLLLNNGILGLFIFALFLRNILKLLRKITIKEKVLVRSLFYAYLVMSFFQSFDLLYMYLMLVLAISYVIKKETNLHFKFKESIIINE